MFSLDMVGFRDQRDYLIFDIAFALGHKVAIRGFRRALTQEERQRIAATIADHLRLCLWDIRKGKLGPLPPSEDWSPPPGGSSAPPEGR